MTYKVTVQEKYTTHTCYATQMSICRKCFVWIYILENFKSLFRSRSIKSWIQISM